MSGDEFQMINRFEDMIEMATGRLGIDGDSGYTEGYDRELAGEVYRCIPESGRGEILRWLVEGVVSNITMGAINMLDETSEDTYTVDAEITDKLIAAIVAQDRADDTLLHLIAHEIGEREHMERVLKHAA